MNTYYIITAKFEGQKEELFGSFDRNDCQYELEGFKEDWKSQGYKGIKIERKATTQEPDPEVYPELALKKDLTEVVDTYYEINEENIVFIDGELYDWNSCDIAGLYECIEEDSLGKKDLDHLKERVKVLKSLVKAYELLKKYGHICS